MARGAGRPRRRSARCRRVPRRRLASVRRRRRRPVQAHRLGSLVRTDRHVPARIVLGMSADAARHHDTLVGIEFPDVFRAQEFLTATTRLAARHDIELARRGDGRQQRRRPRHRARDPRPADVDDGGVRGDLGRAVRPDPRRTGRAGSPARRSARPAGRSRRRSSITAFPTIGSTGSARRCVLERRSSPCSSASACATPCSRS